MIFSFIGVLALRFLVTVPATRRAADGVRAALQARTDRVLLVLAGGLILLFIPFTLALRVNESTDPDLGLTSGSRSGRATSATT